MLAITGTKGKELRDAYVLEKEKVNADIKLIDLKEGIVY